MQAATAPRRTTPFVDEALVSLWEEFAAARPTAHLLVNTMRQSAPRRRTEGECLCDVTVENQAQVDVMNETAPELLAFLSETFSRSYNVYTATNGVEALKITSEHPVDIVVSDVMMPEMDGIQALKEIKKIDGGAKVIMCSAKIT